jgi:hypothetical protein
MSKLSALELRVQHKMHGRATCVYRKFDSAPEIGTFSLKTKGPMPQGVAGKYVVVWEKVGGDWKLAADIWNDGN